MMSSLIQQRGDVPNIILNVGYPINNGEPSTEELCSFFDGKGLNIRRVPFEGMGVIQFRGLARNRQLEVATGDYILFADTDMVYDPLFFDDLQKQLKGDLANETRCISARRVSLEKDFCKNYFNNESTHPFRYPCEVPNAGEVLKDWPIYQISRNCGAGYFQLANRLYIKEKLNNLYVEPKSCADYSWEKMQKARSDGQFRRRLGGVKRIKTKPQYHLNHERDNEVGYHLTLQR
jgi:hypothetical protein